MRRIAENAGASPDVVAERVGVGGPTCGFNAATGEYGVDLVAAGVVDPTKVTRLALEHAASVAAAFVSISAAIIEE
jgi:chaperonin GroEL